MGKCKKRALYKTNSSYFMTRESAVNEVFSVFEKNTKKDSDYTKLREIITLFGITSEELSEAGVSYENLRALDSYID